VLLAIPVVKIRIVTLSRLHSDACERVAAFFAGVVCVPVAFVRLDFLLRALAEVHEVHDIFAVVHAAVASVCCQFSKVPFVKKASSSGYRARYGQPLEGLLFLYRRARLVTLDL
jgi:hypothetical protein